MVGRWGGRAVGRWVGGTVGWWDDGVVEWCGGVLWCPTYAFEQIFERYHVPHLMSPKHTLRWGKGEGRFRGGREAKREGWEGREGREYVGGAVKPLNLF